MTRRWDVAVVGAGPSGTTAARALATAGRAVILLDKATLPRDKPCGGGLVGRSLAALPPDLEFPVESVCSRAYMGLARDHRPALGFTTRRNHPIVTMVMRRHFDAALTDAAAGAGATIQADTTVTGLDADPGSVTLHTSHGPVRAGWVVAADGVHSPVARFAGFPPLTHAAPAVEWEIPVSESVFARFAGTARFDLNHRHGYAWVFPKAGHLSVGILSVRTGRVDLNGRLKSYLAGLDIPLPPTWTRSGHLIPLTPRPGPCARGRVLLTGDAAGFADPLTGEGISYALTSGKLAAHAILEAGDQVGDQAGAGADMAAERYVAACGDLLAELRAARWLGRALYGAPWLTRAAFKLAGQSLCERVTDVICGQFGYRQLLSHRRPSAPPESVTNPLQ